MESQSRGERRDGQLGVGEFRDVVGRIYITLGLEEGQTCSSLLSNIECALQCDFVRAFELSCILLTSRFAPLESVFGAKHVLEFSTDSRRTSCMTFALTFACIATRTLGHTDAYATTVDPRGMPHICRLIWIQGKRR